MFPIVLSSPRFATARRVLDRVFMRRWLAVFALAVAGLIAGTREAASSITEAVTGVPLCTPPFITPAYTRPRDDGVALSTLIEGAGYGASTNSGWVDIASGNLCGGAEKEL